MELQDYPVDDNGVQVGRLAVVRYEERWDILKPMIQKLYIDQNLDVADVASNVLVTYGFTAQESQYKYRFKKWQWKKNIPTPKKAAIFKIRQTRAKIGKSTQIVHHGHEVEKKLRRHVKETTRRGVPRKVISDGSNGLKMLSRSAFLLGNSAFLSWSIPHGNMHSLKPQFPSPFAISPASVSTPSDIVVISPLADNTLSPRSAPSPLTKLQSTRENINRAYMFLEGHYGELMQSMSKEERKTMSTWLYQFWYYGFKTAKHWGHGPREWNAEVLQFEKYESLGPARVLSTPRMDIDSGIFPQRRSILLEDRSPSSITIPKPSPLCCWSIHYSEVFKYESCSSRTPSPELNPDPLNEDSWKPWPSAWEQPVYQRRLLRNLATNEFSNMDAENLPIAVSQIVKASERSNNDLLVEALGFSIMARNPELVQKSFDDLLSQDGVTQDTINDLNLFHLATTYLDGSKSCCNILDILVHGIDYDRILLLASNVSNLGHTVFDNLMIAILKAHTSVTPGVIDGSLRDEDRFPGEEVDICGRWDADSDCVRALISSGDPRIPFSWKHKFCHTAAQTVCHCLRILEYYSTKIGDLYITEIPSGIFLKRCVRCGLKMQLQPLHTVVMTAFNLAQSGTQDEDLFGMLAVLLHAIALGANPLCSANISASALLCEEDQDASDPQEYAHEHLRPSQLANSVPEGTLKKWSDTTRTGWEIFRSILHFSETELQRFTTLEPELCTEHEQISGNFGGSRELSMLYAAVQTELLTYRRLEEGDPWTSPNFNMHALLEYKLGDGNEGIPIDLIKGKMMKEICHCGSLKVNYNCHPRAEQVMRYYFSNLDIWSRSTFIPGY